MGGAAARMFLLRRKRIDAENSSACGRVRGESPSLSAGPSRLSRRLPPPSPQPSLNVEANNLFVYNLSPSTSCLFNLPHPARPPPLPPSSSPSLFSLEPRTRRLRVPSHHEPLNQVERDDAKKMCAVSTWLMRLKS